MGMDCEQFRTEIEADPAELTAGAAAHEAQCAECAAYAERMRNAEALIARALRFDVAAVRRGAVPSPRRVRSLGAGWLAVAAALVGGVAVWLGEHYESRADPDQLVAAVIEHWPLEPESWVVTHDAVAQSAFEQVTSSQARIDRDRLGLVSYAHLCYVDGHWIPHLVVQGKAGPVMVLLLPGEELGSQRAFTLPSARLKGILIPLGKGTVAVLGTDQEPLEPLRERVSAAVHWRT